MYFVMDAHSFYNFIYFILLIIVSDSLGPWGNGGSWGHRVGHPERGRLAGSEVLALRAGPIERQAERAPVMRSPEEIQGQGLVLSLTTTCNFGQVIPHKAFSPALGLSKTGDSQPKLVSPLSESIWKWQRVVLFSCGVWGSTTGILLGGWGELVNILKTQDSTSPNPHPSVLRNKA